LLEGKPVAYITARAEGDVLIGELMGFDPKYAACNPGFAALSLMIQSLFQDRFRRLEFGPGDYAYKSQLSTGAYEASDVFLFRPTLRNRLWVLAHSRFRSSQKKIIKGVKRLLMGKSR
jgi:CelD/BcsL family acetyltransferase involved in cellulose biosynthesis